MVFCEKICCYRYQSATLMVFNDSVSTVITSYRHMSRRTNARTALPDRVPNDPLTSSECSSKSDSSSSESVSYSSICSSLLVLQTPQ